MDLGGALLAAAGAALTGGHPVRTLLRWGDELRFWGVLAALGGSFEPLRHIEAGLFGLQLKLLVKEVLVVLAALVGAYTAWLLLLQLVGSEP